MSSGRWIWKSLSLRLTKRVILAEFCAESWSLFHEQDHLVHSIENYPLGGIRTWQQVHECFMSSERIFVSSEMVHDYQCYCSHMVTTKSDKKNHIVVAKYEWTFKGKRITSLQNNWAFLKAIPWISYSLADLRGREGRMPPPPLASKFFRFHAVFGKIWQNCVFTPYPPPRIHAPTSGKSFIRHWYWYLSLDCQRKVIAWKSLSLSVT